MRTVEHTTHHGRIHQFTFFQASRETVDEWMTMMRLLYERKPSTERLLLLIDMSESGILPLTTIHIQLHQLFETQQERPKGRVALVLREMTMPSVANSMLQIFNKHNETQSFLDYDKAWDWIART
jgi:hypothetical protein